MEGVSVNIIKEEHIVKIVTVVLFVNMANIKEDVNLAMDKIYVKLPYVSL
jgi:hypothetical protein